MNKLTVEDIQNAIGDVFIKVYGGSSKLESASMNAANAVMRLLDPYKHTENKQDSGYKTLYDMENPTQNTVTSDGSYQLPPGITEDDFVTLDISSKTSGNS